MSHSSLVDIIKISPNTYGKRTHIVDTIVGHIIVGQCNTKRAADIFSAKGYRYSCNYTIGNDGGMALILEDEYASICTSSKAIDNRALTVEIASDTVAPYKITNAALSKFIYFCADTCRRYSRSKLVWIPDKAKNKAYEPKSDEMKLSCHRFYANKSCPGDYVFGLESAICERVNQLLAGQKPTPIPTPITVPTSVPKPAVPIVNKTNTFDCINYKFNGIDMKPIFNPDFYYNNYPDLQKALNYKKDNNALFRHFCINGLKEARQGIQTFNPITYKANYADLANAFGNNWVQYYQHYLLVGIKEGRKGI